MSARVWIFCVAACAAFPVSLASAQTRKVNEPLGAVHDGDVLRVKSAPGSPWAVYTADQRTDGVNELFTVPSDGSAPALLVGSGLAATATVGFFGPTPDGLRVVFLADGDADGTVNVYVAPIDASAPPLRLDTTAPAYDGSAYPPLLTPDRVVFVTSNDLLSAPLDGSAAPVSLAGALPSEYFLEPNAGYAVSPDGTHIAFVGRREFFDERKLFRVPVDGSAAPVALVTMAESSPFSVRLTGFDLDGEHLLYVASFSSSTPSGLRVVPADGSGPALRLGPASMDEPPVLDPSGHVVFTDLLNLYSAPVDGSAPAVAIASLGSPSSFAHFRIGGGRVAYRARFGGVDEVYSVPIDGSAPPVKLHPPFVAGGAVGSVSTGILFEVTPDGSRVLYGADAEVDELFELWSVPIDGSQPPVRLSGDLPPHADVMAMGSGVGASALVLADGSRVAYVADAGADQVFELHGVPVDGSAPPVRLSAILPTNGDVVFSLSIRLPALAGDGTRVLYVADQHHDEVFDLHGVEVAGGPAAVLNPPLLRGVTYGDVKSFSHAPDSSRIVYEADVAEDDIDGLFVAPRSGGGHVRELGPVPVGGVGAGFVLTPDGARALFQTGSQSRDLYSVALDGDGGPVRLNPPLGVAMSLPRFALAPDGQRAVFVADLPAPGGAELFSVPSDGGAPALAINGSLVSGGAVFASSTGFRISPDSSRVVYRADQLADTVNELFSVPIDGGAAVRLNPAPVAGGDVLSMEVTGDSARVLFLGDLEADNVNELFSAPIDGGAPAVKLSGTLVAGGDVVSYASTPDGACVLFRADRDTDFVVELYSVPADGGAPAVELSGTLVAGGNVGDELVFTPDSSRVLWLADALVNGREELFVAPVDGSTAPLRLNAPLASGSVQPDFALAGPAHVVYRAAQLSANVTELFVVPLDASAAPRRLSGALVPGGAVSSFAVSPDGGTVLYLADALQDGVDELFLARVRGALPALRASEPLIAGGSVSSFAFAPDGRTYLYAADQDELGVVELYLGHVPEKVRAAATPTRSVSRP